MQRNSIDLTIVMDCSGSMAQVLPKCGSAIREIIKSLKSGPSSSRLTILEFGSPESFYFPVFDALLDEISLSSLRICGSNRGGTALLEALWEATVNANARREAIKHSVLKPALQVIVTLTDGEEGSSFNWMLGGIADAMGRMQRCSEAMKTHPIFRSFKPILDPGAPLSSKVTAFRTLSRSDIIQQAESEIRASHGDIVQCLLYTERTALDWGLDLGFSPSRCLLYPAYAPDSALRATQDFIRQLREEVAAGLEPSLDLCPTPTR